jgi:hypothetical protein
MQSLDESGEPGNLVGCQVKCWVDPYGWCPGVLSDYITKGKFKDHYKVSYLSCMYHYICFIKENDLRVRVYLVPRVVRVLRQPTPLL